MSRRRIRRGKRRVPRTLRLPTPTAAHWTARVRPCGGHGGTWDPFCGPCVGRPVPVLAPQS